jgi:peptidoglycan hydrolase CwlO-like protein
MEAATTHARRPRVRSRRAFRRRRLALGAIVAVAVTAALGINLAGAKDPSLKDKIDAARSDAGQLSDRVDAQTAQIGTLTAQAHQAGAQAMELNAQVQTAEAHSRELASQLDAAERQLDQLRGEYAHSVKELDQRLVAIYESDAPDYVTVLLNSDGFDDLSTRSDYLQALHDVERLGCLMDVQTVHPAHRQHTLA